MGHQLAAPPTSSDQPQKAQPSRIFDPTGQWDGEETDQPWADNEILDADMLVGLQKEGLIDASCEPGEPAKDEGGDEEVLGMDKSVDDENMQGDEDEEVDDKQQANQAQPHQASDEAGNDTPKSKKKRKKKARMTINLDTCSYSVFFDVVAKLGWRVVEEEEPNPRCAKSLPKNTKTTSVMTNTASSCGENIHAAFLRCGIHE